ncbi:golgin subfamily A member 6-like protein 26 isoform X2 [Halyomorpha halys]|uniref:golgin subfamily A member 6-like protein 26 isoform X2 n=1 Tax=Halyomorpha halys TaxID=286706 RepID=UPI0034D361F7
MQNILKSHLVTRDSLRKTERLILEGGTSGILEAWTLFLWEAAEDLTEVEDTLAEVEVRLKLKEQEVIRQENLLEEIERQKELISQLEEALKEANTKLVEESEKSFEEGVKIGRNVAAVEELGVLEELEILKQIESMLVGDDCKNHNNETKEENKAIVIEINSNQEL